MTELRGSPTGPDDHIYAARAIFEFFHEEAAEEEVTGEVVEKGGDVPRINPTREMVGM